MESSSQLATALLVKLSVEKAVEGAGDCVILNYIGGQIWIVHSCNISLQQVSRLGNYVLTVFIFIVAFASSTFT